MFGPLVLEIADDGFINRLPLYIGTCIEEYQILFHAVFTRFSGIRHPSYEMLKVASRTTTPIMTLLVLV